MGGPLSKIIDPLIGSPQKKARRESKKAAILQAETEADIRKEREKEGKKRKSRDRLLETRRGGLGVTLFMNELGVQPGRATKLGGT